MNQSIILTDKNAKNLSHYEQEYFNNYGHQYIIKCGSGYFQYWGFPNTFTNDWMLAVQYKNLKTVTNAIKKLSAIHGEGFKAIKIESMKEWVDFKNNEIGK